jgi:hypothetical protein
LSTTYFLLLLHILEMEARRFVLVGERAPFTQPLCASGGVLRASLACVSGHRFKNTAQPWKSAHVFDDVTLYSARLSYKTAPASLPSWRSANVAPRLSSRIA